MTSGGLFSFTGFQHNKIYCNMFRNLVVYCNMFRNLVTVTVSRLTKTHK